MAGARPRAGSRVAATDRPRLLDDGLPVPGTRLARCRRPRPRLDARLGTVAPRVGSPRSLGLGASIPSREHAVRHVRRVGGVLRAEVDLGGRAIGREGVVGRLG